MKTAIISVVLGITLILFMETTRIVVEQQEVKDNVLASVFSGVRVVQISDLHLRYRGVIEGSLLRKLRRLDPDIVFLTGDLVASDRAVPRCAAFLSELARGRTVIAVLGNNDHSYHRRCVDTQALVRQLKAAGVTVLVNESLRLTVRSRGSRRSLYVVGLDDNYLWYDDFFRATTNVPQEAPKVLLAHAPGIVEKVDLAGVRLVLSGHTHGGQICLPGGRALFVNPSFPAGRTYVSGLYDAGTRLYVSRGIGTTLIPLRLFCRPEITVFRFTGES